MGTEPKSPSANDPVFPRNRAAPLIDRAPLPIIEVIGPAHTVSYVNGAFCRLLGKTPPQLVGNSFAKIVPGGEECLLTLNQVYETGEAATLTLKAEVEPDASHWLFAMWPALDANERAEGVIIQMTRATDFRQNAAAINEALLISGLRQHELTEVAEKANAQLAQEIGERKIAEAALQTANHRLADQAGELERMVADRTEKLRETVGELEVFSYSLAHDLRTPLRGMQGFAHLLLEQHAARLDPEAQTYLERISSAASRMDSLIQGVLNYTEVLRGEAPLAPMPLDALVRDVIALSPDWQPPKVEIEIEGTLPWVLGHEGLLTQCVSNLLDNAVKFVAPGITPRVRIRAELRAPSASQAAWPPDNGKVAEGWSGAGPVVRVWFEDNGIGLDPKDRHRIFRMFERINAPEQFAGTGMGLTIVHKALERMGGRIDFQSNAGRGSRFWFELKQAPERSAQASDAV